MLTRIVPSLLLAGALAAADPGPWSLNGPEPQLEADGTVVFTRGFVGRQEGQTLVADAVRYHPASQTIYATGHVLYRRPEVRIEAARLGLRSRTRQGEAWDVTARLEYQGRTLILSADRLELEQDVLTLRDVEVDLGHGAVLGFWAPTVRIHLQEPDQAQGTGARLGGAAERVAGLELISPAGTVHGLPLLWVPYLYRDFAHDYPWTVVRAGSSRRLGTWGRFWIGTGLPEVGGLSTVAEARVDRHTRAGNGGGLNLRWRHPWAGTGRVDTYLMPEEVIRTTDEVELDRRRSRAYDVEHRANLGAGALYLRSLAVPDPADGLGDPTGHRFLSDFLPDSLERRPFPRRTAAVAYTLHGVTLTADTERRFTPGLDRTERLLGLEAIVAPVQVAGPLHAGASGWLERLDRRAIGSEASRFTGTGYLALGQWFPSAIGLDAKTGVKTTAYVNGTLAGTSQDDNPSRRALTGDAGLSWRTVGRFGRVTHSLTPRIGVELVGPGAGDVLPTYGFQDQRDRFDEDVRYGTTSLATAVVQDRTLFHADVKARWALREQERRYTDADGNPALGPTRLVDVVGGADGSPLPGLNLTVSFTWDARPRAWTSADATGQYRVTPWLALDHTSSLRTIRAGSVQMWEHRPAVLLLSGRYTVANGPTFRPADRAPVDGWRTEVIRAMVEGDLFLSGEYVRDAEGRMYDRRWSLGFTLGGSEDPYERPQSRYSYRP